MPTADVQSERTCTWCRCQFGMLTLEFRAIMTGTRSILQSSKVDTPTTNRRHTIWLAAPERVRVSDAPVWQSKKKNKGSYMDPVSWRMCRDARCVLGTLIILLQSLAEVCYEIIVSIMDHAKYVCLDDLALKEISFSRLMEDCL